MIDPFAHTIIVKAYEVNGVWMDMERDRSREQAEARMMACGRLRDYYGYTPRTLARILGYADRTSVYDLMNRHADLLIVDAAYRTRYERLVKLTRRDETETPLT